MKHGRRWVFGVQAGEREGDAKLQQVIADGHLTAEAVAAIGDIHLFRIVGEGMHQHRHIKPGQAQRRGHASLLAKVRQRHENPINLLSARLEELGTFDRVFKSHNCAMLCVIGRQTDGTKALLLKNPQDSFPASLGQMRGKEAAVTNNNCQRGHSVSSF